MPRTARTTDNNRGKLSERHEEILERLGQGESPADVASAMGVSRSAIYQVRKRATGGTRRRRRRTQAPSNGASAPVGALAERAAAAEKVAEARMGEIAERRAEVDRALDALAALGEKQPA